MTLKMLKKMSLLKLINLNMIVKMIKNMIQLNMTVKMIKNMNLLNMIKNMILKILKNLRQ